MKTSKIQELIKSRLLTAFKPFACTGRMMFAEPHGSVLRGVHFDDSSFSKTVLYAWAFVQPFYVRKEYVHFTFGHRLRNRLDDGRAIQSWDVDAEPDERQVRSLLDAIRNDAIPYIERLATPRDLVEHLAESTGLHDNVFVKEAVAYSLAKIGNYADAKVELEALVASVRPSDPWHGIKPRAEELLVRINEGPKAADGLLGKWEQETARNLHLPFALVCSDCQDGTSTNTDSHSPTGRQKVEKQKGSAQMEVRVRMGLESRRNTDKSPTRDAEDDTAFLKAPPTTVPLLGSERCVIAESAPPGCHPPTR